MNNHEPLTRLRTYRRSWGLTQRELAGLLGGRSPTHIARIEAGKRPPSIEIALACQIIFGIPPEIMFPRLYTEIEEREMQGIYRFHEGLLQTTSPLGVRKRTLLERAMKRAISTSNSQGVCPPTNLNRSSSPSILRHTTSVSRGSALVPVSTSHIGSRQIVSPCTTRRHLSRAGTAR